MLADIGLFAVVIAFLLAVYATFASFYGGQRKRPAWVESARNAAVLLFPLLTVSVVILVYLLYTLDFSIAYVADVSSLAMSPFLRVTALWGGQQGSVLFWAWMMSGFVMVVLLRKWQRNRELMPYVIAVSMLTTAFFIGLVVFITNPFARLWLVPGPQGVTPPLFPPPTTCPLVPPEGGGPT